MYLNNLTQMPNQLKTGLEPITEDDFENYLNFQIQEYAKEKIKSGNWSEKNALELSKKSFLNLLSNGKDTLGHSIMTIVNPNSHEKVGVLWVEWNNKEYNATFIWDIIIYENFRRKGFASGALNQLENMCKEKGSSSICLHVFGHNKSAITMYNSLGYYPTNIIMKKDLERTEKL